MLHFGSREEDIWIVTYPKSGTTVMQMIVYQLTTPGDLNFKHINNVCPWVRNAATRGLKPPAIPNPRILKSHDRYNFFDKNIKGRFIFVIRDGKDVAVSLFHQLRNYNNPELTFDEFFKNSFSNSKSSSWYVFNKEWLNNKSNRKILYIRYEDILKNKRSIIERVNDFLSLNSDEATIDRALERSSFEFMKLHEDKFGIEKTEDVKVYDQFIRKGVSGDWESYFSVEQLETYNSLFEKQVEKSIATRFNS
jgi:hypothetical protein